MCLPVMSVLSPPTGHQQSANIHRVNGSFMEDGILRLRTVWVSNVLVNQTREKRNMEGFMNRLVTKTESLRGI